MWWTSDGVYRKIGPARVFTSEQAAIAAVKGLTDRPVQSGDVILLIGCGPLGTGMEETYQLTSALRYLPHGKTIALLTDARFSGVSTGACIGHIGPEALAGGPIGRVRDGDILHIEVDRVNLTGQIDLIGEAGGRFDAAEGARILAVRPPHPGLQPNPDLPDDTRLWAALQNVSGGTWGGCVYDVESNSGTSERTLAPVVTQTKSRSNHAQSVNRDRPQSAILGSDSYLAVREASNHPGSVDLQTTTCWVVGAKWLCKPSDLGIHLNRLSDYLTLSQNRTRRISSASFDYLFFWLISLI